MKRTLPRWLIGMMASMLPVYGAAAHDLDQWPTEAAAKIEAAVAKASAGSYATFDADNTTWKNDIEESLLPYLENKGILSISRLDPSLRPIPILPGESLYGYYIRMCEIDDKLCYPWIAQMFAGRPLVDLKRDVDAMMAAKAPIPVRYAKDGKQVSDTVMPPQIFPAQRQLMAYLTAKGVTVYIISASAEELVRMIVSDPKYGLNLPPENVIGVTMLLRDPANGSVTTARSQIAARAYVAQANNAKVLTPILWSPLTWQEGKVAGIQAFIDPIRRPLLAAGDSRSDWPMLFYTGGVRIWVDRKGSATPELARRRIEHAATEHRLRLTPPLGADAGWVIVTHSDLVK